MNLKKENLLGLAKIVETMDVFQEKPKADKAPEVDEYMGDPEEENDPANWTTSSWILASDPLLPGTS